MIYEIEWDSLEDASDGSKGFLIANEHVPCDAGDQCRFEVVLPERASPSTDHHFAALVHGIGNMPFNLPKTD